MDDVRNKILISAQELLMQEGYKKTTIRKIVERSGVLTGSIYYLFKNKEEIFRSLIVEVFDQSDKVVFEHFGKSVSPVFRYAILCALELKAVEMSERIGELYYAGYSSNIILDGLVNHAAKRSQSLFQAYYPDLGFEDAYLITLAIKGVMRNFISDRYLKRRTPMEDRLNTLLDISLSAYHVPQYEIKQVKEKIAQSQGEITEIALQLGAKNYN